MSTCLGSQNRIPWSYPLEPGLLYPEWNIIRKESTTLGLKFGTATTLSLSKKFDRLGDTSGGGWGTRSIMWPNPFLERLK